MKYLYEKKRDTKFFPVLLNIGKLPCLVVGGGEVAYRKVMSLLEFNGDITVISPKCCKPLNDLVNENKIKLINKVYSEKYIKNFKIVFCATDNRKINIAVYEDCKRQGILINAADLPEYCDFILPANVKRGNLIISISSQGKSPFFVKYMKEKLNRMIPPVYSKVSELAGNYRKLVLDRTDSKPNRQIKKKMFKRFTDIDWEKEIEKKGIKKSKEYIKKILNEFK